jgi:hypothetical protein
MTGQSINLEFRMEMKAHSFWTTAVSPDMTWLELKQFLCEVSNLVREEIALLYGETELKDPETVVSCGPLIHDYLQQNISGNKASKGREEDSNNSFEDDVESEDSEGKTPAEDEGKEQAVAVTVRLLKGKLPQIRRSQFEFPMNPAFQHSSVFKKEQKLRSLKAVARDRDVSLTKAEDIKKNILKVKAAHKFVQDSLKSIFGSKDTADGEKDLIELLRTLDFHNLDAIEQELKP